jgi:hypothetical protein
MVGKFEEDKSNIMRFKEVRLKLGMNEEEE